MRVLRRWTPGQWALKVAMVLGVLGALLTTGLVGVWPDPWLVLLVGLLALGYAVVPETSIGTVAMGLVLAWWGIGLREGLHWQALVAAACLLLAHLAGLVAAYGPDRMAVDPATVLLWVRRGALVFLMAPLVLVLALWVAERPEPGGLWVAGMTAAVAALAVAAALFVAGTVDE